MGNAILTADINDSNSQSVRFGTEIIECTPQLPKGMIAACSKLLSCKINTSAPISNFQIKFELYANSAIDEGNIETGEILESIKFFDKEYFLTLATRDGDWIEQQAEKYLPIRLKNINNKSGWVEYTTKGIVILVPELKTGEKIEFFLSISWANRTSTDPDMLSTWFAADMCLP